MKHCPCCPVEKKESELVHSTIGGGNPAMMAFVTTIYRDPLERNDWEEARESTDWIINPAIWGGLL